jgi:hypothetical protein
MLTACTLVLTDCKSASQVQLLTAVDGRVIGLIQHRSFKIILPASAFSVSECYRMF